jgi:hypothetical protein
LRAFGAVRAGIDSDPRAGDQGEARNRLVRPMWKTPTAVALVALVAAACAAPAAADGQRGWRSRAGAWPVGAITANVITPDYYGYYGGFYSYHRRNYYPGPLSCWREGYRLWVCW